MISGQDLYDPASDPKGDEPMFFLFRYNKDGIPQGLIRFHDLLLEDTIEYFEKGKIIRKRIKDARKAINKAIKIARKKERNPGVMLGTAHKAMKGLHNEVAYTRKALKAIYSNMEKALKHIEQERIEEPAALIEKARVCFEQKDFKEGIALLKESKEQAEQNSVLGPRLDQFTHRIPDVAIARSDKPSDDVAQKVHNPRCHACIVQSSLAHLGLLFK